MLTLVTMIWAAGCANAETISKGERDRAMSSLHATRKLFLDSITGLSKAQWEYKPDANTWSIAECAEHIALSEDSLLELVTKKVMTSPPPADGKPDPANDEKLLTMLVDRGKKFQAPEFLRPTRKWATAEELIAHFKTSRDRTIEYVETTQGDLRAHAAPHPVFKALDAYQWILLISGHSERHTLQLNEVKRHPSFPKK